MSDLIEIPRDDAPTSRDWTGSVTDGEESGATASDSVERVEADTAAFLKKWPKPPPPGNPLTRLFGGPEWERFNAYNAEKDALDARREALGLEPISVEYGSDESRFIAARKSEIVAPLEGLSTGVKLVLGVAAGLALAAVVYKVAS